MKKKLIIGIIVTLLLLIIGGWYLIRTQVGVDQNFEVMMRDAVITIPDQKGGSYRWKSKCEGKPMQCPNGTLVGKVGPNCEYDSCPQ